MDWCSRRIDSLIERAVKNRAGVCRRAYKNCIRRNRQVIQYKYGGFKVYQLKTADTGDVQRWLDSGPAAPAGFDPLEWWRTANFLHKTGLLGHAVCAYAIRRGESTGYLYQAKREGALAASDVISRLNDSNGKNRDSIQLKTLLIDAGDFLRRLHMCGMDLTRIDPRRWHCIPSASGRTQFFTDDLNAYQLGVGATARDRLARLAGMMAEWGDARRLIWLMQGYCAGKVKRGLLREIVSVIQQ